MSIRPLMLLAALAAGPALAGQASRSAQAAKTFQLDSLGPVAQPPVSQPSATPTPEATATPTAAPVLAPPTVPDSAAVTAAPDPTPASAAGLRASFTLETPIADLIADPAARAILDRDLPGLSTDENLPKFAKLGLRQFQPLTGGQLTDAMLGKVARDLSTLSGPLVAPIAPTAAGTSKRNRDASR